MTGQRGPQDAGMITRFTGAYRAAGSGGDPPPWDWGAPHAHLERWARERQIAGAGRSAIVVGCGYADDAAFVASLGFRTTGFDFVAEGARRRHPEAGLDLRVADLFALPAHWAGPTGNGSASTVSSR